MMRHSLFSFLAILFFLPSVVFAQLDATLTLKPANPAPYDTVTVTLSSYSFDVNTATIVWSSNGKDLLSGMGKKSLTLTLGGAGQAATLKVQATLFDGSSVSQQITISPQTVDLVYEAKESYVPPFYEGRSLPAEGSSVRITALPVIAEAGKKIADSSLAYSWYVDGDYVAGASGVGRSSFQPSFNYLKESLNVSVMVRSPKGSVAEKEITILPHPVLPLLYAYDDLLGTDFSRAFIRRLELSKDITLSLHPFYLSTRNLEQTASYDWYLDGLPVTPQERAVLSLRPKKDSYGTRMLTVAVDQTKRRLQNAEAALEIIFDTRD